MGNIRILSIEVGVFIGASLLIWAGCGYQESNSPTSDDLSVVQQQLPSEGDDNADGDDDWNRRGEGDHKDCQESGYEHAEGKSNGEPSDNSAITGCERKYHDRPDTEKPIHERPIREEPIHEKGHKQKTR